MSWCCALGSQARGVERQLVRGSEGALRSSQIGWAGGTDRALPDSLG